MAKIPAQGSLSGENPLISFVIPAYNPLENFLHACIDSLLAVKLNACEREIIVVDDGSAFPLAPLLTRYGEEVSLLIREHQGPGAARNVGLDAARGEYVQFVDADDCVLPTVYNACIKSLRQHRPHIFSFDFTRKEQGGCLGKTVFEGSGATYLLTHNLHAAVWGYVFRRDICGNLRFPPTLLHEDEVFTPLLFLRAQHIMATSSRSYFYRYNTKGIMLNKETAHLVTRLNHRYQGLLLLQQSCRHLPPIERKALTRRMAQLVADYLWHLLGLSEHIVHSEEYLRKLYRQGLFPETKGLALKLPQRLLLKFAPSLLRLRFFFTRRIVRKKES